MKRKIRSILMIALMLHSCFISMNCMTVNSYTTNDLDSNEYSVTSIKSIHLKSGKKLMIEDNQIRIVKLANDTTMAFLVNTFDTTWSDNGKNFSVNSTLDTVMFNDVGKIVVKNVNVGLTVLASVGILAGVLLIVGIIGLGTADTEPIHIEIH